TAWAASAGTVALIEALNRAYEARETRGFWKIRGIALLMVVVLAFFFITSFALLAAGDWIGQWIGVYSSPRLWWIPMLWKVGHWVLSLLLLGGGVAVIYYALPNVEQRWSWVLPGSLFVALVWVPASLALSFYVKHFASSYYDKTYGSLGAFMLLMVWIYAMSLVILIGAEINSELNKASSEPGIRQAIRR